jgi:hypothetical protein
MNQTMQQKSDNKSESSSELKHTNIKSPSAEEYISKEPASQDYISHLFLHTAAVGGADTPSESFPYLLSGPVFSHSANSTPRNQTFLQMQQTFGNHYVQRMVEKSKNSSQEPGTRIQAKLKIGQPNDIYEREADRIADQVMRMPEPQESLVQRNSTCPECLEEEKIIQTKPIADQITPLVQRQTDLEEEEKKEEVIQTKPFDDQKIPSIQQQLDEKEEEEEILQTRRHTGRAPVVTPSIEAGIKSMRGGGQPLPESVRSYFEPRFGVEFSQVRVHTGSQAASAAKSLHAKAFTSGKDVVFGAGQYLPETSAGKHLLAHELTHVVQQRKMQITTIQKEGCPYDDILDPYERILEYIIDNNVECLTCELNDLDTTSLLMVLADLKANVLIEELENNFWSFSPRVALAILATKYGEDSSPFIFLTTFFDWFKIIPLEDAATIFQFLGGEIPEVLEAGQSGRIEDSFYVVFENEIRVGGTKAWRTNNPGSLTIPKDKTKPAGYKFGFDPREEGAYDVPHSTKVIGYDEKIGLAIFPRDPDAEEEDQLGYKALIKWIEKCSDNELTLHDFASVQLGVECKNQGTSGGTPQGTDTSGRTSRDDPCKYDIYLAKKLGANDVYARMSQFTPAKIAEAVRRKEGWYSLSDEGKIVKGVIVRKSGYSVRAQKKGTVEVEERPENKFKGSELPVKFHSLEKLRLMLWWKLLVKKEEEGEE